jgi:hypothetical protein
MQHHGDPQAVKIVSWADDTNIIAGGGLLYRPEPPI